MKEKLFASILTMLTSMFSMDKESTIQEIHQKLADEETLINAAVKEAEANTRQLVEGECQEEIDMLKAKVAELEEANQALTTEADGYKADLAKANETIETLSEEGDGSQAHGETDPPKDTKKKSWESSPINQKAAALRAAWRKS